MSRQNRHVRSVEKPVGLIHSCLVTVSGLGAIDLMCVMADLQDSFGGCPGLAVFLGLPPQVSWDRLSHTVHPSPPCSFHSKGLTLTLPVLLILCLCSLHTIQHTTAGMTEVSWVDCRGVSTSINAKCFLELSRKLNFTGYLSVRSHFSTERWPAASSSEQSGCGQMVECNHGYQLTLTG